jgi:hypothetical protein
VSTLSPDAGVASTPKRSAPAGISPIPALTEAFSHTLRLLFDPFDVTRWLKLSALCLFLGGGASWAAIHWSLGALPAEAGVERTIEQLRLYLAQRVWLALVLALVAVVLGVALIYLRALCRFALVDSVLRGRVRWHYAWAELRPAAHSYFRWLLAALVLFGVVLGTSSLVAYPLFRSGEERPLAISLLFAAMLLGEALAAVLMGLAITVTDDLAVPVIYAKRCALPSAWRELLVILKSDAGACVLYLLLRFVVAVGVGVAVLFFLFPALVALFSGSVIATILVVMGLELLGLHWAWTPLTTLVAGLAVLLLSGLLLALMGVASMPGQVFLQSFGMRFIAPRVPALQVLWLGRFGSNRRR